MSEGDSPWKLMFDNVVRRQLFMLQEDIHRNTTLLCSVVSVLHPSASAMIKIHVRNSAITTAGSFDMSHEFAFSLMTPRPFHREVKPALVQLYLLCLHLHAKEGVSKNPFCECCPK